MKLTIDTVEKTILIESMLNMGKLITNLNELFPKWEEYKLIPVIKEIEVTLDEPFTPFTGPTYNGYHNCTSIPADNSCTCAMVNCKCIR